MFFSREERSEGEIHLPEFLGAGGFEASGRGRRRDFAD